MFTDLIVKKLVVILLDSKKYTFPLTKSLYNSLKIFVFEKTIEKSMVIVLPNS